MPIKVNCSQCRKEKKVTPSHFKKVKKHFCNHKCYSEYQKLHPTNTGRTWWKKGRFVPKGEENPTFKNGRTIYRRMIFEVSENIICSVCGEENFSKLVVHHKDKDRTNNKLSNLQIMCTKCHTTYHNTWLNLPQYKNLRGDKNGTHICAGPIPSLF